MNNNTEEYTDDESEAPAGGGRAETSPMAMTPDRPSQAVAPGVPGGFAGLVLTPDTFVLKPAAQPHRHKSTTEFDTQAVDAAAAAAASGTRRPVSATSGLRRTLSPEPAHESDAENGGRPGKGAYFVHPAPTESVEAALLRGPGRRAKGQGVTTVFKQRLDSDHSMHKVLLRATPRTLEELTAMVGCGVVGVGRRTGVGAG